MKAVITKKYGGPEVLEIQEIAVPDIGKKQMLIQVKAFSVNPIDWKLRRGDFRILSGRKPPEILGNDFSGIIEKTGENVKEFNPGDKVWGFVESLKRGSYAEYISVDKNEIGHMPANLGFEEAASVPTTGLSALQALLYKGNIKSGDEVLINGCTGGVGLASLAVAKNNGCIVTGVCSTNKCELALKSGADQVIDYRKANIMDIEKKFDVFFDVVPTLSFSKAKNLLKKNGIYIRSVPLAGSIFLAPVANMFRGKKNLIFDSKPSTKDLDILKGLIEEGKFRPLIEKIYAMKDIAIAHKHSEGGHVTGKLVIKVQ